MDPSASSPGRWRGVCLCLLFAVGGAAGAFGQSSVYHPVKIVDAFTPRPDDPTGKTNFGFNGAFLNTPCSTATRWSSATAITPRSGAPTRTARAA